VAPFSGSPESGGVCLLSDTAEFLARFEELLAHDSYQTCNRSSRETVSLNDVLVNHFGLWFTREKALA